MAEIPLKKRDGSVRAITVVDDEDFERLGLRWHLSRKGYAANGRGKYLHRVLLDAPAGLQVDHIDGDRLNNRRSNLRIVTAAEQAQNKGSTTGTSSRFRGVTWNKNAGKWLAQAKLAGRSYYLGLYEGEEDAAAAAAAWRAQHMPCTVEGVRAVTPLVIPKRWC